MNANNEGTLGENTYRRKYGWQRKRRVVVEEDKSAPSSIDFSYGSYEYGSSLPIIRPVLFGWMQCYPNLPIAPGLPDLPDRLPDLPDRLPDLPELLYELPDLPHGLCDLGSRPTRSTGEDVDENDVKYTSSWMKKIEKITKKI